MAQRDKRLGEAPIARLLVSLSLPAGGGLMVNATYNVADSLFVGRFVGTDGLAAVGLNFPLNILLISGGILTGVGAAALVSRRLGANEREAAERAFSTALSLVIVMALGVVALGLPFAGSIVRALGAEGEVIPQATRYFRILAAGAPLVIANQALNNLVYVEGAGKVGFLVLATSSITNIILDWVFLGAFGWGAGGAALATVISQAMATVLFLAHFASRRSGLSPRLGFDRDDARQIVAIGSAAAVRTLTVVALGIVANLQAGRAAGELGLAVASVVFRVVTLVVLPAIGINQAYLPIAAYNIGAERYARVVQATWQAVIGALLVSFTASIAVIAFAPQIAGLFNPEPEFIETATRGFRTAFILTPFIIFNLVGSALFQAVGEARWSMLIGVSRMAFFIVPLMLILPFHFGLRGVWLSFPLGELAASVFAVLITLPRLRALSRQALSSS